VVVANDPSAGQAARLATGSPDLREIAGAVPEIVWTSERLGRAAAVNVGLQRARGALVVVADASIEPAGDPLSPLEAALTDPDVAVAGPVALVTADLRRFEEAPGTTADVVALPWLAFRRSDYIELGPFDEKLALDRGLDTWWSLVLRAGADPAVPPRAARRVELPVHLHERRIPAGLAEADRERLERRGHYRILDRFRERRDLLSGAAPTAPPGPAPRRPG
jgi:hypothetical protein